MSIIYDKNKKLFHLQTIQTSYVIGIIKGRYPAHLYWGRKIKFANPEELLIVRGRPSFSPNPDKTDDTFSLDTLPQEYPGYGNSDFRTPAFEVQLENGSTILELSYVSHSIIKGKPKLQGLPSTYVEQEDEAETLELILEDVLVGLRVVLSYTVFEAADVITRSVRFINKGDTKVKLQRVLSMSVDFSRNDFELLHLSGAWARERHIERVPVTTGNISVHSSRGASSHQHNPFIALLSKNANEEYGEVYGFSLVYSGNFLAQAEIDQYQNTRISMGINPFDFSWQLNPDGVFQSPEVVMVYSSQGIGQMSRIYHKLYRTRLCRGNHRDKTRPVLINNWEATYFDFTAEKIETIGKAAKELGIELLVLDDGWFGKRDDDRSSLGDWVVYRRKLPNGLDDLATRINKLGLKFGLWFEPEMISPDSELYKVHPDWCLHVPGRTRTEARHQLILDLSREEVCEYIIKSVSNVLRTVPIAYVKWDMNRNMTEIGSACLPPENQREIAHRYMLGLYRVLDEITSTFPEVLFESCSGGGGRFDPGMLYYMPQTWTSDDTDAVERLKIQYGTSIVYPAGTMGAHVSAIPNHQINRSTSLRMRGHAAMSGNFGYELDLTKFSEEEKEEVKDQVAEYKGVREIIQFGDMYRLLNPFEGNETAWIFVSQDKKDAFAAYFRTLAVPNGPVRRLRLRGLDPDMQYSIVGKKQSFGGDELMYAGLALPDMPGDYQSVVWRLKNE